MAPCRQLHARAAIEAAKQQASTASHSGQAKESGREMGLSVKVSQLAENGEAVVDLFARELLQPLGAEALASEGTHHAAVEHGAAEGGWSEFARCGGRGQVAEESSRKAVARAGEIDHFFQRQRRGAERVRLRTLAYWRKTAVAEESRRAILAVL